jgi:hypothetical protein
MKLWLLLLISNLVTIISWSSAMEADSLTEQTTLPTIKNIQLNHPFAYQRLFESHADWPFLNNNNSSLRQSFFNWFLKTMMFPQNLKTMPIILHGLKMFKEFHEADFDITIAALRQQFQKELYDSLMIDQVVQVITQYYDSVPASCALNFATLEKLVQKMIYFLKVALDIAPYSHDDSSPNNNDSEEVKHRKY